MKAVSTTLANYLNRTKRFISCDLYELKLNSGSVYRWTNTDKDITYNGNAYKKTGPIISRAQTKINDSLVVDTMTINIYADTRDTITIDGNATSIKRAAHDGYLDRATFSLLRAFFMDDGSVEAIPLFSGITEINSCGGLDLQLTVKAKTQGLSQEFPRRKYYPQGTYSTSSDGKTSSNSSSDDSCLITPFLPQKEVLL
jgi:hypothetical protein